ncbi:MAG: hypothetical protein V4757_10020 [Pseudomonadota bacterium]
MKWTELPKGRFTGIDWSAPGATAGFDPYLIWAEADRFAGYGKHPFKWLSLIIELTPHTSVAQLEAASSKKWLHVPPAYTSRDAPAGLRFCTARVRREFFDQIRPGGKLHKLVRRFELGMSQAEGADDPTGAGERPYAPVGEKLKGKVLGLVDGGLAFANANFLNNGRARVRYFWRQDQKGKGASPEAIGYGHELTAKVIDQALAANTFHGLVDEGAVYRHFDLGIEMDKLVNHGTHVMDLLGGPRVLLAQLSGGDAPPSWALADDDASRAPLVMVQIDWHTVLDTSGGSMNVHLLDGLMYILSRCDATARTTINLSWGTLAGPHDGTSVLEAAMDQLIELQSPRLQIVVAAGNGYQDRTHANATLVRDESVVLHWQAPPDDKSQNFLELWIEENRDGLEIQITPPGRPPLPALKFGQSGIWTGDGGKPLCALIYPTSVATGTRGTCALVAVAATFSEKRDVATAPSGSWQVKLTNRNSAALTVDAYIERDGEIIGVRTGARQSHFEDRWYDTSGNPDAFVDHPDNPSPIRRSGIFNSIATGKKVLTTGGVRYSDNSWARYSPRRPDPDDARRERPGVVKVPDTQAVSDASNADTGVGAAGSRSGAWVRLAGTSAAAPQIARKVLNAM